MAPGQDSSATRGEDHGGAGCPPAAHGGPRRGRDPPAARGGPHAGAGGGLKEAVARGGPAGTAVLEGLHPVEEMTHAGAVSRRTVARGRDPTLEQRRNARSSSPDDDTAA